MSLDARAWIAVIALAVVMGLLLVLSLGSIIAMAPFLIWRLVDEERFLARNLPGYAEYERRGGIVSCRSCGRR